MSFVVDDGKSNAQLVYPDQINAHEDLSDRRPRAVNGQFGDAAIEQDDFRLSRHLDLIFCFYAQLNQKMGVIFWIALQTTQSHKCLLRAWY